MIASADRISCTLCEAGAGTDMDSGGEAKICVESN